MSRRTTRNPDDRRGLGTGFSTSSSVVTKNSHHDRTVDTRRFIVEAASPDRCHRHLSRKVVAWTIHETESEKHARSLIAEAWTPLRRPP